MPLRILHIGKFYPPAYGGIEAFVSGLVLTQREQGLDSFVLVHGSPQEEDPTWLRRVPVQANIAYAPIALGFGAALSRAIDEFRPQVLHLHAPNPAIAWALLSGKARKIPWVVHWHSDVVPEDTRTVGLAYALYRPFEQAMLKRAQQVIVTSPAYLTASEPLRQWREKCIVIPLGVPDGCIGAVPSPEVWKPNRLRLLSLGRLARYKGHETLIRAVCQVPGLQLVIAGGGESRQALLDIIEDVTPAGVASNIQLIGRVSEEYKNQLFSSCDAVCLASTDRTEAFGVILLEAMAHSKPCVVSDLPGSGVPWVVAAGQAGPKPIPLGNVEAWRKELTHLATQPLQLKKWGAQGKASLSTVFSLDACAKAIEGQYLKAVRNEGYGGLAHSQ